MIMRQDESTDVSGRDLIRGYKASGARTPLKGCIPNTTGDPVFDGTLRQGIAVQLEQSPFLRLVSEQQIRKTLPMMAVTLARASLAHTPGPSTNTEGTQFTSWNASETIMYPAGTTAEAAKRLPPVATITITLQSDFFGVFAKMIPTD